MPVGRMVVTGSFTTFTPTPGLVDGRSHRCNALSPRVLKLSRFIGARCTWLNSKMNNFFPRNTPFRVLSPLYTRAISSTEYFVSHFSAYRRKLSFKVSYSNVERRTSSSEQTNRDSKSVKMKERFVSLPG